MNLRNIRIVYAKELLDLLRDRRTIISMVVVPIILMPAIMISVATISARSVGQARQEIPKVMVIGGKDSPDTLHGLESLKTLQLVPASADYTNLISDKKIRAAVEIPSGFEQDVRLERPPKVRIYIYEGEMKSMFAAEAIEQFFRNRKDAVVSNRLAAARLPTSTLNPFDISRANVAPPQKVSGNIVGMILPYLVIIMCMTGSIYPSIDLTAGEKERGTIETLLTSPANRTHLVLGKCLIVMTMSLFTALVSLASNGVAISIMNRTLFASSKHSPLMFSVEPSSLLAVAVLMVPLAVFFAALMVAIGLYSRSSKEAQSYLQPMLILTVVPAMAAALPGVELNTRFALIPVLNVSLLSKEVLSGTYHLHYMVLVFASMCVYAAIAIFAAVAAFKRETVLFRT